MVIKQKMNLLLDIEYNGIYKYSLEEKTYNSTKDIKGVQYIIKVGVIVDRTQRNKNVLKVREAETKLEIET